MNSALERRLTALEQRSNQAGGDVAAWSLGAAEFDRKIDRLLERTAFVVAEIGIAAAARAECSPMEKLALLTLAGQAEREGLGLGSMWSNLPAWRAAADAALAAMQFDSEGVA